MHCAKFGENRPCSFKDARVSMLCEFGLKMPIHAAFGEFFWSKIGENETFCSFIRLGM